ncbi:unnamed protein product [Cuscuta epithymum]|uniref:Aspartic proteinase Asp1 n=2 Tax=Cuscuta epithymum TaxID=186058 RepID=A0AAV0D477_9ASTE|nr:unnamed protein product [Cuscuta epithymum]
MGGRTMVMMAILVMACASFGSGSTNQHQKWTWMSSGSDGSSSPSSSSSSPSVYTQAGPSSIVLPLYGNVYPKGFYFVQVDVGHPSKPYFLDPDTGSDLTWLQCDAPCVHCTRAHHPFYKPNNDLVICKDPLCASLHPADYKCDTLEQCDYEVEYADGGSSLGVLLNDVFSFNLTSGVAVKPHLALGCGYDQIHGPSRHPSDGVLGLGKGKTGILSQLKNLGLVRNVVGHCLSSRGGGYLFLGDDVYDASRVTWTPMSHDITNHYAPGPAELLFGSKSTGVKNLHVVFDSGSSFSYLNTQPYEALLYLLEKELRGKPLKEADDDPTLPLCWTGRKPFMSISEVKKYFKSFSLSFAGGWKSKTLFEIPPDSYLIISSKGNVCMGVLNGTEAGLQNFNIIGDVSMQDRLVIFDNEKSAIGWTRANCDRPPVSNIVFI